MSVLGGQAVPRPSTQLYSRNSLVSPLNSPTTPEGTGFNITCQVLCSFHRKVQCTEAEEPHSHRGGWQRGLLWSSCSDADLSALGSRSPAPLRAGRSASCSPPLPLLEALGPSMGEGCTLYTSPLNCYTFLPCSLDRGLCYQRAGEKLPSGTACAFQTDG